MNKNKIVKVMPTVLFVSGIVGIFVSEVMVARDTLKAERIIKEKEIHRMMAVEETEELAPGVTSVIGVHLEKRPLKEYAPEIIKATWKSYIPSMISTSLTIAALIASNRLSARQIALLSSAVMSTGGLVTKYRDEIRKISGEDILREVDKAVAESEITKAKPPVISNPTGPITAFSDDLNENEEVLFFDEFTGQKFYTTKLAFLGAKYYLNRNFQIGGGASLQMFYAFLGLDLPEEYNYAGWDVCEMMDDGYCWIDIDVVKSDKPDPETGKLYYTVIYGFEPGDTEYSYSHYPSGSPLLYDGSVPLKEERGEAV